MTLRVPCKECGAEILPTTAEATGGVCMACRQGIRKSIEQSKLNSQKAREYSPWKALWADLVNKVYKTEQGMNGLTPSERVYYVVGVLEGEVYNGGFSQFFTNSSGSLYQEAVEGLYILKATQSLELLQRAKTLYFGNAVPPKERRARYEAMRHYSDDDPNYHVLDKLDSDYYKNPDKLSDKLCQYAESNGLITPFYK